MIFIVNLALSFMFYLLLKLVPVLLSFWFSLRYVNCKYLCSINMFILIRNDEIASKSLLPELNLLMTKITILPTTTTFLVSPSLYFFQIITISKELKLISTQLLSWSRYYNDYLGYFAHCLSFSVIVYLCSLYLLFTFNFKVNPGFTLEFFSVLWVLGLL